MGVERADKFIHRVDFDTDKTHQFLKNNDHQNQREHGGSQREPINTAFMASYRN
jgi:hypothetical protein